MMMKTQTLQEEVEVETLLEATVVGALRGEEEEGEVWVYPPLHGNVREQRQRGKLDKLLIIQYQVRKKKYYQGLKSI